MNLGIEPCHWANQYHGAFKNLAEVLTILKNKLILTLKKVHEKEHQKLDLYAFQNVVFGSKAAKTAMIKVKWITENCCFLQSIINLYSKN